MTTDFSKFRIKITNASSKRNHSIKTGDTSKEAYKWLKDNKIINKNSKITISIYRKIIRNINKLLAKELINGNDIILPFRMGRLEVRKYNIKPRLRDNKIVSALIVDWKNTMKLWYEDPEACKDKILIKKADNKVFTVIYNKNKALYKNKTFYKFIVNRDIVRAIKNKAIEGELDAFNL